MIKDKLIENKNKVLTQKKINIENPESFGDDVIKILVDSSYDMYSKYKNSTGNTLSELLFYIASFFSKNIFFEIASPNEEYILSLINNFCNWYNYKTIFIYTYLENTEDTITIIKTRTIERGLKEGRFVDNAQIINKIPRMEESYNSIK